MDFEKKELRTPLFTIFFIILLIGIGGFNMWVLLNFRKIKFTKESQKSGNHSIVEGLLWTLSILPLVLAIVVAGFLIYAQGSQRYKIPLIGIIVSLLFYAGMQFTISYFWKNLIPENVHDNVYVQLSNALLIAGYTVLPSVLIIGGIWWIIKEKYINIKIQRVLSELEEQKKKTKKISGEAQKEEKKQKLLEQKAEKLQKKKSGPTSPKRKEYIEMINMGADDDDE